MRVNIKWRFGEGAGRGCLSETAGSPTNHRPVRPNAFASSNGSRSDRVQLRPRSGGLGETAPYPRAWATQKNEESVRGDWTGTDSLLLAWWLFLELTTLNWSSEIY